MRYNLGELRSSDYILAKKNFSTLVAVTCKSSIIIFVGLVDKEIPPTLNILNVRMCTCVNKVGEKRRVN